MTRIRIRKARWMIQMEHSIISLHTARCIQTGGRVSVREDGITFFWTGSSLEFIVSGSELSVDLDVPEDSLCPWVCIYLNGHLLQRCLLRRGRQTLPVYDHLNYTDPKHICIIKDSPALLQNAVYGGETLYTVTGLCTDGTFFPQLNAAGKLKIELIGDSITSGEGLFGYPGLITEDLWFFTSQPELHYGTYIARQLDADLRIVTQAGWGVYIGYNNMPSYNIPSIYEQVCGAMASPSARSRGCADSYDFRSWQPDIIIVNLGTNDAAAFANPGFTDPETGRLWKMRTNRNGTPNEEDLLKIEEAALFFLHTLRRCNPGARILWCYGMMGHEMEATLQKAVLRSGDPKTTYVSLPDTLPGEFGSVDHPGIPSHKKTADTLLAAIHKLQKESGE